MPKRARQTVQIVPSHCHWCGEKMDQLACQIDFHAVYVAKAFKEFLIQKGRLPSEEELKAIDNSLGSDPCDDCCCGSCGSRKKSPGAVCC